MRVIIQAGHEGRTTGSTGAPGERAFNSDVANRLADILRGMNVEVRRVNADPSNEAIMGDWDLFIAIHYDADVYNDDGGFVDYPEPSTDAATEKSQAIAKTLSEVYFAETGIKNVPSRSNKNTRYYYMWKRLSAATPCVIIECGVGNREPRDKQFLQSQRDKVANALANGILKAFGLGGTMANMYKGYDLANPESMKVAVDVLVSVMAGDYLKRADAESALNEAVNAVRVECDKQVTEANKKADNLLDNQRALVILLGLAPEATHDEVLGAVKRLIDEANVGNEQHGTPANTLPTTYNGKEVVGIIIKP